MLSTTLHEKRLCAIEKVGYLESNIGDHKIFTQKTDKKIKKAAGEAMLTPRYETVVYQGADLVERVFAPSSCLAEQNHLLMRTKYILTSRACKRLKFED